MITQAAVRRNGDVVTGRRHGDCILVAVRLGWDAPIMHDEQGFVDEDDNFYTRQEALEEAVRCGQLPKERLADPRKLTSEELW